MRVPVYLSCLSKGGHSGSSHFSQGPFLRALDTPEAIPYGYILCVTVRLQMCRKQDSEIPRLVLWQIPLVAPCSTSCCKDSSQRAKSPGPFQSQGPPFRSTCGYSGKLAWCERTVSGGSGCSSSIPIR